MIENCITNKTSFFEIHAEQLIKFNTEDVTKFDEIAKSIHEKTGVPQELIYTAPYFFFIDNWHEINGKWYFFKSDGYDFHFINELLGEVISEYFDLETVHYMVAKLCIKDKPEKLGLASENFCDPDSTYKRCWDFNLDPQNNFSVLGQLRPLCADHSNYLALLKDMKKFFIRDFYASQLDRTGNNFLFKITNGVIRLAPLYDYENSFEATSPEIYRNQIVSFDITNKNTQRLLKNDLKFQELLNKLIDANILEFLAKIEDKHQIIVPYRIKKYYFYYECQIKKLVLENRILK